MNFERVLDPAVGSIVQYIDDHGISSDVYITSGARHHNGRISNYWYWREIKSDGRLGPEHSGYGNFFESMALYDISVCCECVGPRLLEMKISKEERLLLEILSKPKPHWSNIQTKMSLHLQELGLVKIRNFVPDSITQEIHITYLGIAIINK